MTRKPRLTLPIDLQDKFSELLGGKRPTMARLHALLDTLVVKKESLMPLDKTDLEAGREPITPQFIAEAAGADVGEALGNVIAAQNARTEAGRKTVQARMAEHRERGLDPLAPPEDPAAAAAIEDDAPPMIGPPPPPAPPLEAPDDEAAEIAALKSAGTAKLREVADTMERRVLQRMPQIRAGGSKLRSLEEAAEILIAELQPGSQDAIRQVCAENGLQPWVVILGAVDRMAQLQELHAGEFDPEWLNRQPGGARPASVKEQKCQACGGVLPADARRGQGYCCSFHGSSRLDHNEGCSLSYLVMREGRWIDTRGVRA